LSVSILIVDDHTIIREGLRVLLEKTPDFSVVAEAGDGQSALALAIQHKPDIVLMDINMPGGMNGIQAAKEIIALNSNIRVIALTMNSDKQVLEQMLRAGAQGFLLKDCAAKELAQAIRTVLDGQMYFSFEMTSQVVQDFVANARKLDPAAQAGLTPSEINVLKHLADGLSNKQIAAKLHISTKTVEMHRMHLMDKLQLHSVAELTKYAIFVGLSSITPTKKNIEN